MYDIATDHCQQQQSWSAGVLTYLQFWTEVWFWYLSAFFAICG